ncbi:hypothetical protein [Calothrix sp. 336/3]|uniref:hypothetical protein n=1 Tax=Calothrix sp. 336/3 TaxID=1337936 RepID=UPI0004E35425|nr:hypothetical protein [Calothrix sp. 336/3]AKG23053.1 hypothetical protein IJ00_18870 [Calothrix sp. 336/3]
MDKIYFLGMAIATFASGTIFGNFLVEHPAIASKNQLFPVTSKSTKPTHKLLSEKIIQQIYRKSISDYAGHVKRIVNAERVAYPFYCEELRAGKTQPLTCDPPNIKDTWKITVDTYFERLVYYVRDDRGIKLGWREYLGKANPIPADVQKMVFADAEKNWGLRKNTAKIVSVRETLQPSGVDWTALPIEPRFDGQTSSNRLWEIIITDNQVQFIYFVKKDNPIKMQLWSRLNYAHLGKIPVEKALLLISRGSQNLGLESGQLLITKVEKMQFDGCLGLAAPWQACTTASLPGYRIIVRGQNNIQAVYRMNNRGDLIIMEGTKTLPPRNDTLPNLVATKILQDASKRWQTSTINLRINSVKPSQNCISANPQAAAKCNIKVYVTNGQKQLAYHLDRQSRNITKVEPVSAK